MAMDEGTTNARVIVFDKSGEIISYGKRTVKQIFPHPGWVEENPEEIWNMQISAAKDALKKLSSVQLQAIGITNQRESIVVWDKEGHALYNAIIWQCRRTSKIVEEIRREYGDIIREKTGLTVDSYFSAPKIKWLLDNVPHLKDKVMENRIFVGTVDSYILYRLTGTHATDVSNASRTMLMNLKSMEWDDDLLEIFQIPENILPRIKESSCIYGYTRKEILGREIPVGGILGDQQSALLGEGGFERGIAKVTYGTGNFLLVNTGEKIIKSENLISTVAWKINGHVNYALEGSVFVTGNAIRWLQESLGLINSPEETERLASEANGEGLYFVPAFTGLGAPYWDQFARGVIIGITHLTGKKEIVRGVLEGIGYLTEDVIREFEKYVKIREIRVDGGASHNDFLMQFQADISGKKVIRPKNQETTALGAAFVAGLSTGYWEKMEDLKEIWQADRVYVPQMSQEERERRYGAWKEAVKRALGWARIVEV